MMSDVVRAVILGVIEGVTEFLPVSSTGHLLLAERFFDLGEGNFWKSFAVLIQLGAILAILAIYFVKNAKTQVAWFVRLYSLAPPRAVEVFLSTAKYSRTACSRCFIIRSARIRDSSVSRLANTASICGWRMSEPGSGARHFWC